MLHITFQVEALKHLFVIRSSNMSDEVAKAIAAEPTEDTIFGKILRKEIPCTFIYEDEKVNFHFILIDKCNNGQNAAPNCV